MCVCVSTTVCKIRQRIVSSDNCVSQGLSDPAKQILHHFVAFCLLSNPLSTGESITRQARDLGMSTSASTVNRIARKMSFESHFTQRTEKLTERHRTYRVEFAANIPTWIGYYLPWVFTDESMIVMNPFRQKIRIIRGVSCAEKFVEWSGYPVKLMVWAAVGKDFKSDLIRIDGHLTADSYQKLLTDSQIFEKLSERFGHRAFVFQQDGARPHTAASTLRFLSERTMLLPDSLHWPAMSPDLSVIENLWAILKRRIDYRKVNNVATLYDEAQRVWAEIPIEVVNNAINDFEPRLRACQALGGDCLNAHKAVLEAFRVSSAAGFEKMQTQDSECDQILRFKSESQTFFNEEMKRFTSKEQLPEDARSRTECIAENSAICERSCEICNILPDRIKRKMKLPLNIGKKESF